MNSINHSNLQKAESLGKGGNNAFNCWGGTLFVLDKSKLLEWVDNETMTDFLNGETVVVSNRKAGDILCLYLYDRLVHTAIFIDTDKLWHKRGWHISEYAFEEAVKLLYEHDEIEIRRLK